MSRAAWILAAALVALFIPSPAAHGAPGRVLAQARSASAQQPSPGVVNINTASIEELSRLPGIGETRAQAIIAAREARRFRRAQEIMRVRGIGRATFRRLRPMLTVEGPTTLSVGNATQR